MTQEATASGQATTDTATTQGAAPAAGDTLIGGTAQEQTSTAPEGTTQETPATDPTAAGEATKDDEGTENKAEKPAGAPEEYEDFALPEGVTRDPEINAEFKQVAKELNLTQEQAQKLSDLGSRLSLKNAEQMQAVLDQSRKQWAEQTRADTEIGGDHLDQNLAVANNAINTFGTPELRKLLNESGLGNHPEVIRAFYRAGKAISEDSMGSGGSGDNPAGAARAPEDILYPNQK